MDLAHEALQNCKTESVHGLQGSQKAWLEVSKNNWKISPPFWELSVND